MFAPVENFPHNVTIITCSQDSLAREAIKFADKLGKGGKDVVRFEAAAQGHAWDKVNQIFSMFLCPFTDILVRWLVWVQMLKESRRRHTH